MPAQLIVRADFSHASAAQIVRFPARLRRQLPRAMHSSQLANAQEEGRRAAELLACLAFVRAANAVAKDVHLTALKGAFHDRGFAPPEDETLGFLYAASVGAYFAIDAVEPGSVIARCTDRSEKLALWALVVAMWAQPIWEEAYTKSDVGQWAAGHLTALINAAANRTEQLIEITSGQFPFVVQSESDEAVCRVTVHPDEKR
jgi:hypothetical protein